MFIKKKFLNYFMDDFTQRDLIELLKSIALSMKEIKDELFDIKIAIRELNSDSDEDFEEGTLDEEVEEDGKIKHESEGYAVLADKEEEKEEEGEKFSVTSEDSYIEIEPNKKFEEDDELESDDMFKDNPNSAF
jgi:hypothetical protein